MLSGLMLLTPRFFADERGFFFESYRKSHLADLGIDLVFPQDNFSESKKGTIRALHYQSHPGQAKLISCIQGEIFDVAVDIRPDSPTFGQWEGVILDDKKREQFFIPVGFAHGYCVLSEKALVHYKVSAPYDPKTECSIRWNDPDLAISWPVENPLLSLRDQTSPLFKEAFTCAFG